LPENRLDQLVSDLAVAGERGGDGAAADAGVAGQLVHLDIDSGFLGTLPDLLDDG
jgi:hypothetical protein